MTGRKTFYLLCLVTLFTLCRLGSAADCADAIKPSNEIHGCEWKESKDPNNCKTFTISCGSDSKIDKGCLLDSDNGPCFAHITRYYYNARVGKCSPFVFGGCSANSNNFNSMAECSSVCVNGQPRKTPDVSLAVSATGTESLNCTGVNEQYYGCGACDSSCNSTTKAVCSLICRPAECGCIDGYVRNANNVCVAPDKCKEPIGPSNLDPNAGSEDVVKPKPAELEAKPTIQNPTTTSTSTVTSTTTQRPTTTSTSTVTSTTTQRPTTTSTSTVTSTTTQRPTTTSTSTVTSTTQKLTTILATVLSGVRANQNSTQTPPTFTLHPPTVSSLSPKSVTSIKCGDTVCSSNETCRDDKCVTKMGSRQLCSLIACPNNYSCQKGICIPPSNLKKCDKLKMAITTAGCKHSFRNDSKGCSIPYLLCGNITCGQNEEAKLCGACDGTCGSPVCIPAEQCRKPSCGCFVGYVRNKANKCVPKSECSSNGTTKSPNTKSSSKSPRQTTIIGIYSTTIKPSSSTPGFNSFHSKVINSIYRGAGPVQMTSVNNNSN